jgi:hypothetical protein
MDTFGTECEDESETVEEWYIVGRWKLRVLWRSGAVVFVESQWS